MAQYSSIAKKIGYEEIQFASIFPRTPHERVTQTYEMSDCEWDWAFQRDFLSTAERIGKKKLLCRASR